MIESPDKLSVYERIGSEDHGMPHCLCGNCKFCDARGAGMIAIDHLAQLIPGKPPTNLAVKLASIFLSPGEADISRLVGYLEEDFSKDAAKIIQEAAAEFRKCETMEEASGVAEKFPVLITTK